MAGLAVVLLTLTSGLAVAQSGRVTYERVPLPKAFAEAAEDDVLRWACAQDQVTLVRDFDARRAPFDASLLQRRRGRVCHIDYTPSLPGFRAYPDDLPITELIVSVETLALVSQRTAVIGDALDISARIVEELPRPVSIVLTTDGQLEEGWYQEGARARYGTRASFVSLRTTLTPALNPWTQDFLKSGAADGEPRMLVPRRLFEGRADDGAAFAPLLDAFRPDEGFVRSQLAWEGGDIQFVTDPRNPSRLVMFHGQSARGYWGTALTDAEYAYVLRREFGADHSIDTGDLTPHADYFVSFVPDARLALVAEPVTDRLPIARAAAVLLAEHFEARVPPTVRVLHEALQSDTPLSSRRGDVRRLIAAARRESPTWAIAGNPALYHRVETHVFQHCPTDPATCFNQEGIERLLESDIALLRDWLTESRRTQTTEQYTSRLIDIIESQVEPLDADRTRRIAAKVAEIEALGFRVVRVPRFGSDQYDSSRWAGLGYANTLLVDEVLFVPMFGLGDVEAAIVADLEAALPEHYRVVPVYARHMLVHNGGVHCTVAIVRRPDSLLSTRQRRAG